MPGAVLVLLLAVAALSAWKPRVALFAVASILPIATWIGRTWNESVSWPETLVVAFAAGYIARGLKRREPLGELDLPVFAFSGLVIASVAVRLIVLWRTTGGEALAHQLVQLASADYFVGRGGFVEVDAAMRLLEGMVLLRASAWAAHVSPSFFPRLVRFFVAGAAAAAALNVWRLWLGALRSDSPLLEFARYVGTLRYNVHYGDVNAAGSYYVMALLPAIALMVSPRGKRWAPAAVLSASSLLLSGSRAALLAGAVAALAWTVWRLRSARTVHRRGSWAFPAFTLLVVAFTVATVLYVATRRNLTPSSTAIQIRVEFAETTMRMIGAQPAFGVGVGQYPQRVSDFGSPVLVHGYGMGVENAHNNFLQILGEMGIVGLAAFLWVLWAAAARFLRAGHGSERGVQAGVGAGLLAFVLTWLSGHPLLVDEPGLLFWLLLGGAAGSVPGGTRAPLVDRRPTLAVAAVLFALAVSVPVRARHEFARAELEHQGIGVSVWHHDEDGVRYRLAAARSTVFVPSHVRTVTIPLRSARQGTELLVSIHLNGRPADAVRVSADRWFDLHLVLPVERNAPRFSRLEFRINDAELAEPLLMIGKAEPR